MIARRQFAKLLGSASFGGFVGCSILPQERIEPAGLRNPAAAERGAENRAQARSIELAMLGAPAKATPIGYGFIPWTGQTYVVFQDGSARLFSPTGRLTELERFAPRIDDVFLAGPGDRRIIGFSHRGTSSSWNTRNLSQQLVLNPQQTTFGQRRAIDASKIADSPVLAQVTEGRRIELWSLVSGNLSAASQLPEGVAPRTIMRHSTRNRLVFGTETGEVRVWSGSRHTRLLYRHQARVLSISRVGHDGYLSTGQDGRALYYSRKQGRVIGEAEFTRASYESLVAPDHSYAVALPTRGLPVLFDAKSGAVAKFPGAPTSRYSQGQISQDGRYFAVRHFRGYVSMWNVHDRIERRLYSKWEDRNQFRRGDASISVGFVFAAALGLVLVANNNSIQVYLMDKGQYVGTLLTTREPIVGLCGNKRGDRVLVCLSNGQLLRFRPRADLTRPVLV